MTGQTYVVRLQHNIELTEDHVTLPEHNIELREDQVTLMTNRAQY